MWNLERCYERVLSTERHGRLHEEGIRRAYEAVINEGDIAIDGGAHSGKHTVPLAVAVGDTGLVVAFEPSPEPFERLSSAVEGLANVTAIRKALSDRPDTDVAFLVFPDRPGVSGFTRRSDNAGQLPSQEITVNSTTIDELDLPRAPVSFIKLDVEGAELLALRGAQTVVDRHRPIIHVEASYVAWDAYGYGPTELLEFAERFGYRVYDVIGIELRDVEALDRSFRTRGVWDYLLVPAGAVGDEAIRTLRQHADDSFGVDTWPEGERPSTPVPTPQGDAPIPRVSVVVPFYGDERFIGDCLRSIQTQVDVDLEIVAVDDCGGDGSVSIVEEAMRHDDRIRLISHDHNRGLAASRNTGIAYATGEMITFLDADDFLFPESLATRAQRLLYKSRWDGTVAGSYCGSEMVPEDATLDHITTRIASKKRLDFLSCRGENPVIATAPLLLRAAVLDVGGFDESFFTAEDFEFWMRLLRQGYELVPSGQTGVAYRQKRSGMISDGLAKHARNASRVYDYVNRPLEAHEVSAKAPAPYRQSLGGHEQLSAWLRRITAFSVLAVGAEDEAELERLFELIPEEVRLPDFRRSGVDQVIASAVGRYELKHGELSSSDRNDLVSRAVELLIIEIGSRQPIPRGAEHLGFAMDEVLARGTERVLASSH